MIVMMKYVDKLDKQIELYKKRRDKMKGKEQEEYEGIIQGLMLAKVLVATVISS